jgi:hypothetical protein
VDHERRSRPVVRHDGDDRSGRRNPRDHRVPAPRRRSGVPRRPER